jgi:probable HAF family extracellular repeat protein
MKTKILRNLSIGLVAGSAAVLLSNHADGGVTSKAAMLASRVGRARGGVERADSQHNIRATWTACHAQAAGAAEATAANYPHFRLIDLGTLGGDNAFTVLPAVTLNNRGENIAQASTDIADPYPFTFQDDFIWHGIYRDTHGVVSDLGALTGVAQSLPVWISQNGFIAGTSENGLLDDTVDFPQLRPVLWDRAHNLYDLGAFGGNTGFATAVNNKGQVAGYATNAIPEDPDVASFMNGFLPAGQQVRAFVSDGGELRDLGTLGGNDAAAQAINEKGQVGGLSYTDTAINDTTGLPTVHPFVWRKGKMQDVGSLGGTLSTPASFASGPFGKFLNERGDLAGTSTLPGDEIWHAFVWSKNQMTEIGTFGGDNSEAFFMSDSGQVLGRAEVSLDPFVRHAFLWKIGHMTDLGAPAPCTRSSALAMNSAGQIVGDTGACTDDPDDPYYFSVFYVEKGKPAADLNALITPPSEIHLEDAGYINDLGEISGGGFSPDGTLHAVLLVPTND